MCECGVPYHSELVAFCTECGIPKKPKEAPKEPTKPVAAPKAPAKVEKFAPKAPVKREEEAPIKVAVRVVCVSDIHFIHEQSKHWKKKERKKQVFCPECGTPFEGPQERFCSVRNFASRTQMKQNFYLGVWYSPTCWQGQSAWQGAAPQVQGKHITFLLTFRLVPRSHRSLHPDLHQAKKFRLISLPSGDFPVRF